MFPCVEKVVEYIERDPKKELLVAHGKAKSVRAWLPIDNLRDYIEIMGDLIYLIFVEIREWLDVGSSITILAEVTKEKLCAVGGPNDKKISPLWLRTARRIWSGAARGLSASIISRSHRLATAFQPTARCSARKWLCWKASTFPRFPPGTIRCAACRSSWAVPTARQNGLS